MTTQDSTRLTLSLQWQTKTRRKPSNSQPRRREYVPQHASAHFRLDTNERQFEQLKKQKAKGTKKTAASKKAEDKKTDETKSEDAVSTKDAEQTSAADDEKPEDAPEDDEIVSTPQQSKNRSESFRNGAQGEVQELYRKQTARIEELEAENKTIKENQEESETRLAKAEEELQTLREGNSDVTALRAKAAEADTLGAELAEVQRQLTQAQQTAKGQSRRMTATSPDLTQQLASKTSTVEALELEVSNLRNQITSLDATIVERDSTIKDVEERATTAETATQAVKQELDALRVSIAFPSDETKAASEDPEALTKRITVLESDLRSATSDIEAASKRAETLQQKLDALTKLHKDVATSAQSKDRELADLRVQIQRRDRPSHVRDASEFDLLDEETESGQLQARIRALEAENFDLRRGIWREKRDELQQEEYENVDLGSPHGPRSSSLARAPHSTFQDVINSGISAFTGRPVEPARKGSVTSAARPRGQSIGLLSEDGFDEDAFRQAHEEENKRRIERVKEVKRGLDKWKGWRIDLVDLRHAGIGAGGNVGPIFEV